MSKWPRGCSEASQYDPGETIDLPDGSLSAAKVKKLPTDAPMRKAKNPSIDLGRSQNQAHADDQIVKREILGGVQKVVHREVDSHAPAWAWRMVTRGNSFYSAVRER